MHDSRFSLLCILAILAAGGTTTGRGESLPAPLSADEVARHMDERDTGRDGRLTMKMTLVDHRGRETVRTMILLAIHTGGLDKQLIRFTYPGDLRDTGFLSLKNQKETTNTSSIFPPFPATAASRPGNARTPSWEVT